jgi:hypothetical protein
MFHQLNNYMRLKIIPHNSVGKFMSCSTDLSNRIMPQQLEVTGMQSFTAWAHTEEGRDFGRNFNNLSPEISFLSPIQSSDKTCEI